MSTKAPIKRRLRSLGVLLSFPLIVLYTVVWTAVHVFTLTVSHFWSFFREFRLGWLFVAHLKMLLRGEYSD